MRHDPLVFAAPDHRPARNAFTLPVLCLAVLVAQVDTSVVNLATRPIGAHFSVGVATCNGSSTAITWFTPHCC